MNNKPSDSNLSVIPFKTAVMYWLSLGFISFGGPAGQISLMHQELVERKRWISEKRFLHALNYTMILPGPEAQQLATYMGWLMHGFWGGLIAGSLFVLPSLLLLIALTWIYLTLGEFTIVQGFLYGIKPAVTVIVLMAAVKIGRKALKNHFARAIALAAFIAIFLFNITFPLIIIAAAVCSYSVYQWRPQWLALTENKEKAVSTESHALINDHSPVPHYAQFSWAGFWKIIGIGLGLWLLVMALLITANGWQATETQIAWFFSKAAMVTFGGAYAVLPYVYQGGVEHYGWLTAPQMIDGLALGETTPGPLIMIVAFIGFVATATHSLANESVILAGIVGASIATFFTFLPSFIFIFAGAPFIEATRENLRFSVPLAGITAAVVGVIINLALFFAYHVFWPQGFSVGFEWFAAAIFVLGFIASFRLKVGVIPLILCCGLFGVVYEFYLVRF